MPTLSSRGTAAGLSMAEVERRHILATVRECSNNKTLAARVLGLSVRGLRLKMKAYGSDPGDDAAHPLDLVYDAFNILPSSIAILDADGVIISTNGAWNAAAAAGGPQLPGRSPNYIRECEAASARGSADARRVLEGLTSVRRGDDAHFACVYDCDIRGLIHRYQVDVVPNELGGMVVIHTDVSSVEHDRDTHLPDDRLYEAQIAHRLSLSEPGRDEFVCVLVTLDETERALSIFGASVLAEVAREVARRLGVGTRGEGFVARTGACEFSILWTAPAAEKERCVRRIARLFEAPLLFNDQQMTGISARVGASSFPADGATGPGLMTAARRNQVAIGRRW